MGPGTFSGVTMPFGGRRLPVVAVVRRELVAGPGGVLLYRRTVVAD